MPHAPKEQETLQYAETNRLRLYGFGLMSMSLLICGMLLFFVANPEALWFLGPFSGLLIFYLVISYGVGIFGKSFDRAAHLSVLSISRVRTTQYPSIDIFYAICGEDPDVVMNAFRHIQRLRDNYTKQHGAECTIYICDDSKNRLGFPLVALDPKAVWLQRPNRGEMKKAGNLKYAFGNSRGEYIAIFDADFCPAENFFEHTLPHLLENETVAIVQTPQFFSIDDHETWIGRGAAYTQELFYRLIQVNRNTFGGAICVGTNALYRRAALEPLGGTAQVPYSEDVRTGFNLLATGWKIVYLPIILAKGLCPDNLPAYLLQQHRWALGSISLFFSKAFWRARISLMQRICFLTGMFYYMTTGIALVLMYVPPLYLLIFSPHLILWWNLIFSIPSLIFGTLYQAYWGSHRWGFYAVKARQSAYYAHLFALLEYLTGNLTPWQPTGAATKTALYTRFQLFCFWQTTCFTFLLGGLYVWRGTEFGFWNFIPGLVLLGYNYYLNMTILRDQI